MAQEVLPGTTQLAPAQRDQRARPPVAACERSGERGYRRAVIVADTLLVLALGGLFVLLSRTMPPAGGYPLSAAMVTAATVLAALPVGSAWHAAILGQGPDEFRRLGKAMLYATLLLALIGLATGLSGVRVGVFAVLPATAAGVLVERYLLRRVLHRLRRAGRCLSPVLVAGGAESVHDLVRRTREAPHIGWRVDAACLGTQRNDIGGVPVIGALGEVADHVRRGGYRVVAVMPDAYWTAERLRRLAWALEDTDAQLVVAPVLMEVASPRLHVSGVLGMPLLEVSAPAFTGGARLVKGIIDRCAAALLLALGSPLLLLIAVAIKLGDGGPVFYRQTRIGLLGKRFTMVKFRTMVVDAERHRSGLATEHDGAGPLFKLRHDPRVTRIGAILRRYSLDELPQLCNALAGSMSLVGPRPPLPEESATYGDDIRRRLLVRPGLTGLWQISGRSDLSWDESVRLDLRYVEDWSLALDMTILWKTAHAVLRGRGAY